MFTSVHYNNQMSDCKQNLDYICFSYVGYYHPTRIKNWIEINVPTFNFFDRNLSWKHVSHELQQWLVRTIPSISRVQLFSLQNMFPPSIFTSLLEDARSKNVLCYTVLKNYLSMFCFIFHNINLFTEGTMFLVMSSMRSCTNKNR